MCIWVSDSQNKKAIISLNNINQLIFVIEKCCVFFAVETESLSII
jgi:hypothetical protein